MIRCQRHKRRTLTLAVPVTAGLMAAVQPLHAQDVADRQGSTTPTAFEEITVTARRRDERAQTVPIAITAFTQADLEHHHIEQARDLAKAVPSLSIMAVSSDVNSLYSGQIRLRGLPGAQVYFADSLLGATDRSATTGLNHGLSPGYYFDLESVDIYKGAQGTLFGRSAISGQIAIEPKRPTDNFEGYVETRFGDYGDKKNTFALNIPVVEDKLAIRAAGQMEQRDGYTRDLQTGQYLDNQNYYAWRIGVTLRPSDSFENYLLYDGYWQDSDGSSAILLGVNPNLVLGYFDNRLKVLPPGVTAGCYITATLGGPKLAPVGNLPGGCGVYRSGLIPGIGAAFAEQQALGPRTIAGRYSDGIGKDYFYGFTDIARWDIDEALTLKNIAAARVTKQLSTYDFTDTGLGVLTYGTPGSNKGWNENSVQYTEEMRLEGRALRDKLTWLAGGYLLFSHPLGYNSEVYDAVDIPTYLHFRESDRSQAVFVHGIYDLSDYVDNLRFSAGYRYSWDYVSLGVSGTRPVDAVVRNPNRMPLNCFLGLSDGNCFRAGEYNGNAPSWNLGLDDQIATKTLVYVRAGNTYHQGGLNLALRPPLDRYSPEHVTDVEVGIKSDWTIDDISARTNADVFHADYRSIQVSQFVLIASPNSGKAPSTQPVLLNAASAELEGFELEQTFSLPHGIDLNAQGAYFNGSYDSYPATLGGGKPGFEYVPRFAFGATATYHLPVDDAWGKISAAISWSWTGHQSVSPLANEQIATIPHYQDFDLRADWTDMFDQPFDSGFFMTNATDGTHLVGVAPLLTVLGATAGAYGAPRMFGFSFKYRFGPD